MADMTATTNAEAMMTKQLRAALVAQLDRNVTWLGNPLRILDLTRFEQVVRTQNTLIRLYLATVDGRRLLANNDGGLQ